MYLTKIELDLGNRTVRGALGDCQRMHRLLNGLFDCSRDEVKLLYRIQNSGRNCAVYLYSESPVIRDKILPFMVLAGERDVTAWQSTMTEGRRVRFDLLTMPSKKVAQTDGRNSRRRILRTEEERMVWLARKASQNGFEILDVQELEADSFAGNHEAEQGGRMNWDTYHYRGILEIRDASTFQKALSCGIGPGKAYGLGMILLI